jgi:hypothetical protein
VHDKPFEITQVAQPFHVAVTLGDIPHVKLIRGVIIVSTRDADKVTDFSENSKCT